MTDSPANQPADRVFASPIASIEGFRFNAQVADVFDDMIQRSVPGYNAMIDLTAQLAARYVPQQGRVYDLGCSLGGSSMAIAQRVPESSQIIAIDNASAMIERLIPRVKGTNIQPVLGDIREHPLEEASFVVLNFTLQFLPIEQRAALIQRIFDALQPNSALVISEKIQFEDPQLNDMMIELYYDYKRVRGYSELEISQKRTALENVLIPETIQQHHQRLLNAGFATASTYFQCLNFTSFVATKSA